MTLSRIKRWSLATLVALMSVAAAIYAWSYWPISADARAADPAVVVANELAENGIEYSESYVESQGNQIHYVSAGEGETIVFLHGFPSYWFTMFGLMEEFKSDYRVVAIDGLGVGKSDAPGSVDEYRIKNLVQNLRDVIKELEVEKVHLVGHDWGVAIATGYARAYPANVETVTAIGALPHNIILSGLETDPEVRKTFSYMSTFKSANPVLIKFLGIKDQIWTDIYAPFLKQGLITKKQADRLRQDIGQARRTDRFLHWYRANFPDFEEINHTHYWPERDLRLTVPALFIYGEDDIVVTKKLVDAFQRSSDSMKVLSFENVAHRPHFERKQAVSAAIRDLIEATHNP